jgi:hypothetical protein
MGVYKLSRSGSMRSGRTLYNSLEAGNQFGAMTTIATRALSDGAVNFTNIPQTYTHLMVVVQSRGTNSGPVEFFLTQFNGSSTGHSWSYLGADGGGSGFSNRNTPGGIAPAFFYCGLMPGGTSPAGTYATTIMNIFDYSNTSTFKTALWRFGSDANGSGQTALGCATFASTSGISRIFMLGSNGTNASATLYGIRGSNQ